MKYRNKIVEAVFVSRPNRFIAEILVNGESQLAHVRNTGRCKELLKSNVLVYIEDHKEAPGNRKTRYSLIAVEKSDKNVANGFRLVNMDSQAPNKVVAEALMNGRLNLDGFPDQVKTVKAEVTFGDSRFDFYLEGDCGAKALVEVKGVTLEDGGVVRFPDAPTERGLKHIKGLEKALEEGYFAYIIFVVQLKGIRYFEPNDATHPLFGQALREAEKKGVKVLAYDCFVSADSIELADQVEVRLVHSQ